MGLAGSILLETTLHSCDQHIAFLGIESSNYLDKCIKDHDTECQLHGTIANRRTQHSYLLRIDLKELTMNHVSPMRKCRKISVYLPSGPIDIFHLGNAGLCF